jgi:O-antigen/teichoic acid export membrane protein
MAGVCLGHISGRRVTLADMPVDLSNHTLATDPVAEADGRRLAFAEVNRRAARGGVALAFRQMAVLGLNAMGSIALARLLGPIDWGIYAVLQLVNSFLNTFAGSGLAANLIRRHREPTDDDYASIFTVQTCLLLFCAAILWCCTPLIERLYGITYSSGRVFRLVAVALPITSFQVTPQVLLERELKFGQLAQVEILQVACFNLVAVSLASLGLGILAVGIALVIRGVSGAIAAYCVKPWTPRLVWDLKRIAKDLSFGVQVQTVNLIWALRDAIAPLFAGLVLGLGELGLINWASMIANICPQALLGLQRVYLPYLSKVRGEAEELARGVEYLLWGSAALSAPFMVATYVLIHQLVRVVFGIKWEPAIPFFLILAPAAILSQTTIPVGSLYYAVGKASANIVFAVVVATGLWIIAVPMTWKFGAYGFVFAVLLIHVADVGLLRYAQRYISPFRVVRVLAGPWLASCALICAKFCAEALSSNDVTIIVLTVILGFPAYAVSLRVINRVKMQQLFTVIRSNFEPALRAV